MPYNYQGITTAEAKIKLDINGLFREGYIKKDKLTWGTITWTSRFRSDSTIRFECIYSDFSKNFRVIYDFGSNHKEVKHYDYYIGITVIKSNLGKGEVPYFICPVTNTKCRILYLSYETLMFCSRKAFGKKFFYECQIQSKRWYANERYHKITDELEKLSKRRIHSVYAGIETKRYRRYRRLMFLKDQYDIRRIGNLKLSLDWLKRRQ